LGSENQLKLAAGKSSRATGGPTRASTLGLEKHVIMKAGVLSFAYSKKVSFFSLVCTRQIHSNGMGSLIFFHFWWGKCIS
jgi:hypothetical protein